MREDVEAVLTHRIQYTRCNHVPFHSELVDIGEALYIIYIDRLRVAFEVIRTDIVARIDIRFDQSWTEHRDADAMRRETRPKRFGHSANGELGCVVDARHAGRKKSGHRSGVDDVAALA